MNEVLNIILLEIQHKRIKLEADLQDSFNNHSLKTTKKAKEVSIILDKLCKLDLKQQKITNLVTQLNQTDDRDSK